MGPCRRDRQYLGSIPVIRGNARQAIKMYWCNSSASSQSDGEKVFGTDAGFAGVWHLGDNLEDSTPNNLNGFNNGSINAPGIIGDGQGFGKDKTINCGSGSQSITGITFKPLKKRYIRLEQTGSDSYYWWSIYEADVYRETKF